MSIKSIALPLLFILLASILPLATATDVYHKVMIIPDSMDELLDHDIKVVERLRYVTDRDAVIAYAKPSTLELLKGKATIVEDKPVRVYSSTADFDAIGLPLADIKGRYGRPLDGEGIKIALIDTGIDYTHNDLKGFPDGKVIGGYDFLEKDNDPMDKDGHGTAVAGIIAADGNMKGIASKARLLAYKITSNGNFTSSLDIVRALEMAARDGANIVNISIGMDTVNPEIDSAVNNLVRKGILVVVAAGNNGQNGIGSPATAKDAVTVGAVASNVSTVVTTLKVGNSKFEGIPMLGSVIKEGIIEGEIVYVKYAREKDVKDLDLTGKIALAERGGERIIVNGVETMERVYFSEKERNVASKGALALLVYNNEQGIFYGTLLHEGNDAEYKPSIPVIALARDDGLKILQMLNSDVKAELRSEYSRDVVATFSSRGPVSPFYIKPNIVAPGVDINSTSLNNSYVVNNGTSFAAPHVSGAAALLMQKYPELNAQEIASLLITTAKPLKDIYGDIYSFEVAGVGELSIDSALNSEILAMPYSLAFYLHAGSNDSKSITIRALDGIIKEPEVTLRWINSDNSNISNDTSKIRVDTQFKRVDDTIGTLMVNVSVGDVVIDNVSKYEAILSISHGNTTLSIPMILYINPLVINTVSNGDGTLSLSLADGISTASSNDNGSIGGWKSVSIKIIDPLSMRSRVVTLTPDNNYANIPVRSGEYWIEATVSTSNSNKINVFLTAYVNNSARVVASEQQELPFQELVIIIGAISAGMVAVLIIGRRREERYMHEMIGNDSMKLDLNLSPNLGYDSNKASENKIDSMDAKEKDKDRDR